MLLPKLQVQRCPHGLEVHSVSWGSICLPAHGIVEGGMAVAALSLPFANPAGTARGESQEHEERKGKAGGKPRGSSELSWQGATPQLNKGRRRGKIASGSFLETRY